MIFKVILFKIFYDDKGAFRNWNIQYLEFYFVFILMFGLMLLLAIPEAWGQSILTNHLGNDMNGARITPIGFIECGKQEPGQPCGPFHSVFVAGCRADDYDLNANLKAAFGAVGVGEILTGGALIGKGIAVPIVQHIVTEKLLSYVRTVNPEWASVVGEFTQVTAEGTVLKSQVSHDDFPTSHNSHDQNFFVNLDDKYQPYNSEANEDIPNTNHKQMAMEWEINDFPKAFWPSAGDRVWMKGPLVWDCGHHSSSGGYQTEIHPPTAVVFSHAGATFFKSTSLSPVLCDFLHASCHDNIPSTATIAHIFISGHGGYLSTPVGGEHYKFDISLPPQPPLSHAYVEIVSKSFDAISAPSPTFVVDAANAVVHVDYDLTSKGPSRDLRFGMVIAAGWKEPVLNQNYHLLKVTIDSVQINKYHNPVCDSFPCNAGGWPLWVDIGGTWIDLGFVSSSVFTHPQSVLVLVPENGKLSIQTTGWNTYKGDYNSGVVTGSDRDVLTAIAQRYFGTSDITTAELKALGGGYLSVDGLTALLSGFKIGIIDQPYSSDNNFGVGTKWTPPSTINVEDPPKPPLPVETIGDFNLGYHIDQVALYSKGSPGYKFICGPLCTTVITVPPPPCRPPACHIPPLH